MTLTDFPFRGGPVPNLTIQVFPAGPKQDHHSRVLCQPWNLQTATRHRRKKEGGESKGSGCSGPVFSVSSVFSASGLRDDTRLGQQEGKRGAQRAGAVSDCAHLALQGLTRACGSPGAQPGPGCVLMLGAEDGRRTPLWGQISSFRDEQWTQPVMSVRPGPGQAYSVPLPAPRELTQHPITAKLEVPTWQIHTPCPDEV